MPASEPYEVSYFTQKHGPSIEKAKEIIEKHGPSRADADAAADRAKG